MYYTKIKISSVALHDFEMEKCTDACIIESSPLNIKLNFKMYNRIS